MSQARTPSVWDPRTPREPKEIPWRGPTGGAGRRSVAATQSECFRIPVVKIFCWYVLFFCRRNGRHPLPSWTINCDWSLTYAVAWTAQRWDHWICYSLILNVVWVRSRPVTVHDLHFTKFTTFTQWLSCYLIRQMTHCKSLLASHMVSMVSCFEQLKAVNNTLCRRDTNINVVDHVTFGPDV